MSTLQELRERPRDEKNAIAGWIALAVVGILFICWLIYFLQEIASAPAFNAQDQQPIATTTYDQGQQALDQLSATTSSYIQVEEISATSAEPGM